MVCAARPLDDDDDAACWLWMAKKTYVRIDRANARAFGWVMAIDRSIDRSSERARAVAAAGNHFRRRRKLVATGCS